MADPQLPQSLTFNAYAEPNRQVNNTQLMYSDDPVIRLFAPRVVTRLAGLRRLPVPGPASLFGNNGNWSFAIYNWEILSGAAAAPGNLGERAPQPVDQPERRAQLPDFAAVDANVIMAVGLMPQVCLFNLIVALEWEADANYLNQLEWSFRRASDFLLDVTDGLMAIGQVIIGGADLMDIADIQIMASNRLLPRAWVDGMHDSNKYQPIRIGRGLWSKNRRTTIAWDEPEAYRTLIHEFAHYALALKDQYVDRPDMKPVSILPLNVELSKSNTVVPTDSTRVIDSSAVLALYHLAAPSIALAVESIMNNLEGTSELMHHQAPRTRSYRVDEWTSIKDKPQFAGLVTQQFLNQLGKSGPGALPLPLPAFVRITNPGNAPVTLKLDPMPPIDKKHCWVFVLRGLGEDPTRWSNELTYGRVTLIAQGSLEATSAVDGFQLMGATNGDTVVLVSYSNGTTPIPKTIWRRLDGTDPDMISADNWVDATPTQSPLVVVRPSANANPDVHDRSLSVEVSPLGGLAWGRWVFPLGGSAGISIVQGQTTGNLISLDGHVLLLSEEGPAGNKWPVITIVAYSIGGNPSSAYPGHPNPIAAGSSEGNAMLFFSDSTITLGDAATEGNDYHTHRVITTVNYTIEPANGLSPRSYAFAVASNKPLPDKRRTLILYYDKNTDLGNQVLRICRYDQPLSTRICSPIPTYLPREYSYAAAPLTEDTAEQLTTAGSLLEVYQLCLV